MKTRILPRLASLVFFAAAPSVLLAWGYPGHRMVNEVALSSLPADFPAWVRTPENKERILFLSRDPDRWRNTTDLPFKHASEPDHQIDLEQVQEAGFDLKTLSEFRNVFIFQFLSARAAHPEKFPPIKPEENKEHVREAPGGYLPWAIAEYYGKLRSEFTSLRTFERLGTPEEVANEKASIIYTMGVMGHYVGDGSQPLHTSVNYNGWSQDNPNGYTTWKGFHAWIDTDFIDKAGISFADLAGRVQPSQAIALRPRTDGRDPLFAAVMDYLIDSNRQVVPLYELDKAGKLKANGKPGSTDGRGFIEERLLAGGQMLGALWVTAWRNPEPDFYLENELAKRRDKAAHRPPAAP